MIRHLLRIVWNRRRANALVALEILLSFLVLCAVATMVVYYVDNYRRPLGYVWQDTWVVTMDANAQDQVDGGRRHGCRGDGSEGASTRHGRPADRDRRRPPGGRLGVGGIHRAV